MEGKKGSVAEKGLGVGGEEQQKNSEGDGRNKEKWNKMSRWLMVVIVMS